MEKEEKKKTTNKNQNKKPEQKKQTNKTQTKKPETKKQTNKTQTKKPETKKQTNKTQIKKPETKKQENKTQTKKPEQKNQTNKTQTKKTEAKKQTNKTQTKKTEAKKEKSKDSKITAKAEGKKQSKKTETKKEKSKDQKMIVKAEGKKSKSKAEKKSNKFIETIKKKWLIDGTRTLILVAAIIAVVVAINVVMQNLELAPIDLSQEKLYTLSEEAKEKIRSQNIDKDVNIYFIGASNGDANVDLVKQFTKINDHIKVETVETNKRPDLVEKYQLQDGSQGMIVECGDRSKVLTAQDLTTYDTSSGQSVSIADQKFTNAILSVTSNDVPKVYFLSGYSDFSLQNGLTYLSMYLSNEVMQVDALNIVSKGKVPDDCTTLVIPTPNKDFDDITTKSIKDYINKGGNILWFNSAVTQTTKLSNVNQILEIYGIKPFEVGAIIETKQDNMVAGQPNLILPEIQSTTVTKNIYNTPIILVNPTKISMISDSELATKNVESTILIETSKNAIFRNDLSSTSTNSQTGKYTVGAEMTKTVQQAKEDEGKPAVKSKLIIYGENYFISDYSLSANAQSPTIMYDSNKNVPIDSIAYLADREEDIVARKSTGTVTYTATQTQNNIIMAIIFGVPALIIIAGLVVWIVRRRKK